MSNPVYPPMIVMGVSGSGKSTVGELLAKRLGMNFIDGDDLHPAANKQKMADGHPLNDADRQPWLECIGARLAETSASGTNVVIACSALKRSYRDLLRTAEPHTLFVHLDGASQLIQHRLDERNHEYMPPTLLESQLSTLEALGDDEASIIVDVTSTPAQIVEAVADRLSAK